MWVSGFYCFEVWRLNQIKGSPSSPCGDFVADGIGGTNSWVPVLVPSQFSQWIVLQVRFRCYVCWFKFWESLKVFTMLFGVVVCFSTSPTSPVSVNLLLLRNPGLRGVSAWLEGMLPLAMATLIYLKHQFLPEMAINSIWIHLSSKIVKPLVLVLHPQWSVRGSI